jgi:hypothetical protein
MTITRTPAETLRAAAARLRELATAATPTPWTVSIEHIAEHRTWIEGEPDQDGHSIAEVHRCSDHPGREQPDAKWIATMSPATAGPLADWLDTTADLIDSEPTRPVTPKRPALDLAKLILGGGPCAS